MEARGVADRPAGVVRRAQEAWLATNSANPQQLGETAGEFHIGHDDVVKPRLDMRPEALERRLQLAAGEANSEIIGKRAQPANLIEPPRFLGERALEPEHAERRDGCSIVAAAASSKRQ